jgi:hypothetical protein
MTWLSDLEKRIERESGLAVGVAERDGRLVLTGLVASAEERQAAEDVLRQAAPDRAVDNDIEVETFALDPDGAPIEAAVDHTESP